MDYDKADSCTRCTLCDWTGMPQGTYEEAERDATVNGWKCPLCGGRIVIITIHFGELCLLNPDRA